MIALLDKIEEIKDPLERQQEVARNFLLRCPEIMGTGVKDGREKDLCKRAGEVYRQAKKILARPEIKTSGLRDHIVG